MPKGFKICQGGDYFIHELLDTLYMLMCATSYTSNILGKNIQKTVKKFVVIFFWKSLVVECSPREAIFQESNLLWAHASSVPNGPLPRCSVLFAEGIQFMASRPFPHLQPVATGLISAPSNITTHAHEGSLQGPYVWMTSATVWRIAGLQDTVQHCLSDRFVGVTSHPVQCSTTGLKKRNQKCELLMQPSNAPNSLIIQT